jgi:hypothetical protein
MGTRFYALDSRLLDCSTVFRAYWRLLAPFGGYFEMQLVDGPLN